MRIVDTVARILANVIRGAADGTAPALSNLELRIAARLETDADQRVKRYDLYQSYYDGNQRDPRLIAFGDTPDTVSTDKFSGKHNFIDVMIDAITERLTVRGFSAAAEGATPDQLAGVGRRVWQWWQTNRMDEHATTVHNQALVKGDAFVAVGWDNSRQIPTFCVHDAAEIEPVYDGAHQIAAFYKSWDEWETDSVGALRTVRHRITRYLPGRIDKFYSTDGGANYRVWTGDTDPNTGESDGGVIDWTDAAGNPLPMPFVHFRNKPRGRDFGRSEVADLIAFQDELNRRQWNASEGGSYTGAPQRWGKNLSVTDEKGQPLPMKGGPGQMVLFRSAPGSDSQIGQWTAGDLENLEDATDRQLRRMASKARVPVHLIWPDGALPSGESLKTAESPLIAKCEDLAGTLGNGWEDVIAIAIRLHNTFGPEDDPIPEGVTLSALWRPFETRAALTDEQVIALKRGDISRRQALRERGYTEDEITRILDELTAETDANTTATADGMITAAREGPAAGRSLASIMADL